MSNATAAKRKSARRPTTELPQSGPTYDSQYRHLFDSFTRDADDRISPIEVIARLAEAGLHTSDPRIRNVVDAFGRSAGGNQKIDLRRFTEVCRRHSGIVARAIRGELVIPDFVRFSADISDIHERVATIDRGEVADYIPQLSRVNPDYFGVASCSVDGQRFEVGDTNVDFCLQSVCKPINYCLALEEHGSDYVHEHIGREPSGRGFNELTLNREGLPHNPMINSGAIMAAALIQPSLSIADRFDYVAGTWRRLAVAGHVGFNNAVYLSERQTADRNFALAYFMREHHAFPPNTDIIESLEFYFQTCSIELDVRSLSLVAAALANGGVAPLTDERIFSASTVRKCLSLMSSCGMYDYSGEFAFTIGVPAKSGVSGALMVVVPRLLGMCIWSPRLDSVGNSARGIEVCKELGARFNFHAFDSLIGAGDGEKRDPRLSKNHLAGDGLVRLCWAASQGDLGEIRSLIATGVDPDTADYDGRTAMHLAASEGQTEVVAYLLELGAATAPLDRWGGTPLSDAERGGHDEIVQLLDGDGAHVDRTAVGTAS